MQESRKNNQNNAFSGTYVNGSIAGETYKAYIPAPLPPSPKIDITKLYPSLEKALKSIGELDSWAKLLPNIELFIYMYVRKEALLSSQIEGTQSSLSDLLLFENDATPSTPISDVEEVSNYVKALKMGLNLINEGLPFSTRLIKEIHKILLSGGRGTTKAPGEFRRSQNWIGGAKPSKAVFVPPPPEMIIALMSDLETFVHDERHKLPALVKIALVHVQFETIHPFLDGNGRLGRLLIILLMYSERILSHPILYLSLYLKEHRSVYYELLQNARIKGEWDIWCEFFLDGITETVKEEIADTRRILSLLESDKKQIQGLGRSTPSTSRIHEYLLKKPYTTISQIASTLNISIPTTIHSVQKLVGIGILEEITKKSRNRIFVYKNYIKILAPHT